MLRGEKDREGEILVQVIPILGGADKVPYL